MPALYRRVDCDLQRINNDTQRGADGLEVPVAVIGGHQHQRQRDEEADAQVRGGTLEEQRLDRDFLAARQSGAAAHSTVSMSVP
jgi:hypothetical protein